MTDRDIAPGADEPIEDIATDAGAPESPVEERDDVELDDSGTALDDAGARGELETEIDRARDPEA